jgi:hypothetical protein
VIGRHQPPRVGKVEPRHGHEAVVQAPIREPLEQFEDGWRIILLRESKARRGAVAEEHI